MTRSISPNELIRRRIQKWEEHDPSALITSRIQKAVASLRDLVAMILTESLVLQTFEKTIWTSDLSTDKDEILTTLKVSDLNGAREIKVDRCDYVADLVHQWSVGAASKFSGLDATGFLGVSSDLDSLFTLGIRSIKKIGLCYGYDTSIHNEEAIVLEIFRTSTSLDQKDKATALKKIETKIPGKLEEVVSREKILESLPELSKLVTEDLILRRALASIPGISSTAGNSANVSFIHDLGWAARNLYANRRFAESKAIRGKRGKNQADESDSSDFKQAA